MRHLTLLVLVASLTGPPGAHGVQDSVTIRTGRLLDGRGGVRENVVIVVRGSEMDAIVSATSLAALTVGLDGEVGAIEAGFQADIIADAGPDAIPVMP